MEKEKLLRRRKKLFQLACLSIVFALSMLPVSLREASAAQITLTWNANREPTVTGYRVYYGTASMAYSSVIDVGNWTSCVISGLQSGVTYYFSATAYDSGGNESGFASEISYAVPAGASPSPGPSSESGGGSGGGCFIATAAYGSDMAPEVMVLRTFRDRYLLPHAPGRVFVSLYYRLSPPVAEFIRDRADLKIVTRWALTPVIFGVKHPGALILPGLLAAMCLIARIWIGRFRGRSPIEAIFRKKR